MVKVGLINNRHPMPVQNYIFEKEIENVFDFESIKNEIKEFILEKVGVHTVLNHGINQTDSQSVSVYSRLYLAKTDGEFEMNIKETLVFENELNTLFNQEENNEKKHIINCMCLATNVADIVASFYLQCRSFDDLCNSYLHYVPNGLAEPNIIWYKARQSYAYVDCKDLLIMNGDDACSVNIQYYVVRFLHWSFKDYAEKYLQQVLDFEGGKYCIYLQRLTSPATLEAVGVCKGSSIKIFKNSDNNELFVICDE